MSSTARPNKYFLSYGQNRFEVKIGYRDLDRLTINVHPNQTITAVVPSGQPWDRIQARIQARAEWIARQVRLFEQFKPSPVPRRYVSGETVLYLGRQYRLRVRKADNDSVRLTGQYLLVEGRDPISATVKVLVQRWYRGRAYELLRARLDRCLERTASLGLQAPPLRIRRMRTRWGSCTSSGTLVLNPDLVMVPSQCLEYVIIHELCHRRVLRHDRRFYTLLERYLPDWRVRKARLDQFVLPESSAVRTKPTGAADFPTP